MPGLVTNRVFFARLIIGEQVKIELSLPRSLKMGAYGVRMF
jgi:hypothetical protein